MAKGDRVVSLSTMVYGGQIVDKGQVIELRELRNDEALVRQGKLTPASRGKRGLYECGVCGAFFVNEGARNVHGNRRHAAEKAATLVAERERIATAEKVDTAVAVDA